MERLPAWHTTVWTALSAATLVAVLVTATAFVTTAICQQDKSQESLNDINANLRHRHRRDANDEAVENSAATWRPSPLAVSDPASDRTASASAVEDNNYFPVYREVGDGRSVDWNGEQMSTEGFDVQSRTDFIDDDDDEDNNDDNNNYDNENDTYDDKSAPTSQDYDYTEDDEDEDLRRETSKSSDLDADVRSEKRVCLNTTHYHKSAQIS